MVQPFTSQNAAGAKSSNGVLLGFSELFRKFYTAFRSRKCSEEFILTLTEGHQKFFFLAMRLELSLEDKIFYFNGDATNEETKVGPNKVTGLLIMAD